MRGRLLSKECPIPGDPERALLRARGQNRVQRLPCEEALDKSEDGCNSPTAETVSSEGAAGLLLLEQLPAESCVECSARVGDTC